MSALRRLSQSCQLRREGRTFVNLVRIERVEPTDPDHMTDLLVHDSRLRMDAEGELSPNVSGKGTKRI